MKKLALALLLLLLPATTAFAAKKPDPAEYTITVHVIGSANRSLIQHLEVVIDGQTMELCSTAGYGGLLALGDYKAKYINMAPKTHATYDYWNRYEIYFPSDGAVRDYDEIAIGMPPPSNDAPGIGSATSPKP